MLLIVTSDHGMALGEHGHLGHESQLYDEFTKVPLFVKPGAATPGAPKPGTEIPGLVQSVDLFPVVLGHAGVPVPAGIDGLAWGRGREDALAWLYKDVRLAGLHPDLLDRELRSAEHDSWKLIESTAGESWLYDLRADRGESRSVAANRPDRRFDLAEVLGQRLAFDAVRHASETSDDPELLERLRALGYIH